MANDAEMKTDLNPVRKPRDQSAIDWLVPGSRQHSWALSYLKNRIEFSEKAMQKFHPRWKTNEHMLQAYVTAQDFEKMLENCSKDRKTGPDYEATINVPFAWAQINTIVTYLLHMFAGRKPIFTVGSYRAEQVAAAKNMEQLLMFNADFKRFVRNIYFYLMDGETYGVAIMRTLWSVEKRKRAVLVPPDPMLIQTFASLGLPPPEPEKQEQEYTAFEGNTIGNIDPYMFLPDPRVPMYEVAEKGEWVAWKAFRGRMELLKEQALGRVKHVDKVSREVGTRYGESQGASGRGIRALGDAHAGEEHDGLGEGSIEANYQVEQGSFMIIPSDWGLSDSKVPERWMFAIANRNTIIQAVPMETPHGMHPVVVTEPNSTGYSFGALGTVDFLGPSQQMMTWFMNSHIDNVRTSINNMLVVDPTKIEMDDLARPGPGKIIRMKNQPFGLSDPKSALHQLQVSDVTRTHMSDASVFGRMAADLTGVSDNMRGLQDSGGRKTATEIRTTAEAGASRLAMRGKLYSAFGFSPLAAMQTANFQNYLTQEFEFSVLGAASKDTVRITPDNIQGDFTFPVHDGTLPIDKVGLLDVWKEIFQAVLADPELRQSHDIVGMFDWICQLGGAQNIQSFKLNVVPQSQQMQDMGNGNGVPLRDAMRALGGMQQ